MSISLMPKEKSGGKYKINFDTTLKRWLYLLAFTVFVFIGLNVYQFSLSSNLENIQSKIDEIDKERNQELEKEIREKTKKLGKLKPLLDNHKNSKKVFEFMERNTFSDIVFSNMIYNSEENTIILTGSVSNIYSLMSQRAIFENSEDITESMLDGVSVIEDGVSFQFKIIPKEGLFNF